MKLFGQTLLASFLLVCMEQVAWGRVFRMNREPFAAYFGGSYGASLIGNTHFASTSGAGMVVDKSFGPNLGGEFGFLIATRELNLRLGVELIKPSVLTTATGSDVNGQKIYDFESAISAVIPKAGLELNLKTGPQWRLFVAFLAGTGAVSYKNSYSFIDGQTTFPGYLDFSDEGVGTANLFEAALGFETLMNDTTTVALCLGRRQMRVQSYKYKSDTNNFLGSHSSGDKVVDSDGKDIQSDFSGSTISLLFRFYIGK